jgi:upstream activation factor subunit UAF30
LPPELGARAWRHSNKPKQKNIPLAWKAVFLPLASTCQWTCRFSLALLTNPHKENPKMATAKKAPAKSAAAKTAAPAKKRTPNAAFMKALTPSPALAAVVGASPLPRTEIISKLWVYIKAQKLQDSANKRMINADAKLKPIFGKDQVSMFEMAGLIGKHVQ